MITICNDSPIHFVIVLTWDNSADFIRCLDSLIAHTTVPVELCVIDNGSSKPERNKIDAAMEYLPGDQINLGQYILEPENLGIPKAQNLALDFCESLADGRPFDVVFLDADTEIVESGWLVKLLNYAQLHPTAGVVGGCKSPNSQPHPVYYHPTGHWYVHDKQDLGVLDEGEAVDFACVYIRPELTARGIRQDARYEIYDGYDQDFCFRVRSWGYTVRQIDAGVIHYGSQAMKTRNYQWAGGGRTEWDALRARNLKRFVDTWGDFLGGYRQTPEAERAHLDKMNQKLVAEAGDRKRVL